MTWARCTGCCGGIFLIYFSSFAASCRSWRPHRSAFSSDPTRSLWHCALTGSIGSYSRCFFTLSALWVYCCGLLRFTSAWPFYHGMRRSDTPDRWLRARLDVARRVST
eukprot:6932660-Prymnesium_polylepis.3